MSVVSLLRDVFDAKRVKATLKVIGNVQKASLYRSFQVNVVNTQPPFSYAFICTPNGIEEIDPENLIPTVKVICTFEVLDYILQKKITFQDAIYGGLVQIEGDNPQLHINILLTFFSDIV